MLDKVFIVSYKYQGEWNSILDICKNRYEDLGFKTEIIEGFGLQHNKDIKVNEVVYLNFLFKVLPILEKRNISGMLVSEDDAFLSSFVTPEFLKNKLEQNDYHNNLIRIGYQKVLNLHEKPRGYICVGSQLIWIPKTLLVALKEDMFSKRPQHLDCYFSKNLKILEIVLDKEIQKTNKYVKEIEHYSPISKKIRKGVKI
tara:strand:- start:34 stop:630 length:597 start_codon:yes stop_codon:yes gene_type:complete